MLANDQVFNPNRVGLDLNNQGGQGRFNSCPAVPQIAARSRFESSSIDFSQPLAQILSSLGNLNENPREGFAIVSACTDTWRKTMTSRYNNQEERVLSLEHGLLAMNATIQGSQSLFLGLQAEYKRMDAIITQLEALILRLRH